jgi:hypothetical protein
MVMQASFLKTAARSATTQPPLQQKKAFEQRVNSYLRKNGDQLSRPEFSAEDITFRESASVGVAPILFLVQRRSILFSKNTLIGQ